MMFKHTIQWALMLGLCFPLTSMAESYVVRNYQVGTTVTLGGTVVPFKEVTLSAQLPGRVEMIAGEEGDHFKKDSVLVGIDSEELLAQRRAAMAEMVKADSLLRNANMQYSRELWSPNSINQAPGGMGMPNMFDQWFTKPMENIAGPGNSTVDRQAGLHSYGSQIEQAQSALVGAQSQIEGIDAKLRDAKGKAPFDGVITKKLAEVGDTVQPGQPLLKFSDTEYLQIEVEVPARLMPGLNKGMMLPARLDVMDARVQVRVAQIFPVADPQRHTVKVKFDLPVDTRTGPGQYAQVEIQDVNIPAQDLVVVPRTALVWRGSLPGVYVLEGNKRTLRLLRLGRDVDEGYVSVLSGLKAGDAIELKPAPGTTSGWVSKP